MSRIDTRDLVVATARRAREQGWSAPEGFNVAEHERATVVLMGCFFDDAVYSQVEGETRGDRRTARKVAWWLRAALLDLGQERQWVEAMALLGSGDAFCRGQNDWQPLALAIAWRRAEVALGQERRRTMKRAVRDIRALDRLESALLAREVIAPVRRAPASATEARALGRDAYAELNNSLSSLQERIGGREEEERSESGSGASSARTTRARDASAREGWD